MSSIDLSMSGYTAVFVHNALPMNGIGGAGRSSMNPMMMGMMGMSAMYGMGGMGGGMGGNQANQAMPKGIDYKAWLDGATNTRPWELAPFYAEPADDNNTAWIIRGFLMDEEIDHIIDDVLPVAGFDMEGRGEVYSWDKSAPLAGAGLMESEETKRHQDSLNWTLSHGKDEGPDHVLLGIERRVTELTGIPFHDRESPLQIGVTTPHNIHGVPIGTALHHDVNARFNRVASVIMYLTDEENDGLIGGHTLFPCLRPWAPGAADAHKAKAAADAKVEAAAKAAEAEYTMWERLRRWPSNFWSGLPSYNEMRGGFAPGTSVCQRLHLDFSAWRLILPHPLQIESESDKPQTVADSETPTLANEMCEQAYTDKPEVLLMKPRRGDAILFLNAFPEDGEQVPQTYHQGCGVKAGKKITLQKFKEVWPDGYGEEFAFTEFDRRPATALHEDASTRIDDLSRLPADDLADGTSAPTPKQAQQCSSGS